jgi:hypothetical protein
MVMFSSDWQEENTLSVQYSTGEGYSRVMIYPCSCWNAARFVSATTTPEVHVRGLRRIPSVQHTAIWVISGNATHFREA